MYKLGFIGAGNMASALLNGIVGSSLYPAQQIALSDPYTKKLEDLKSKYNIVAMDDNSKLADSSEIVILAIKPQIAKEVLSGIKTKNSPLYISILSGVTIQALEKYLPENARVVRVMPNTPALIHEGSSVYCGGKNVTSEDKKIVEKIFKSVGSITEIEEKYINFVTGISGSGPAYFYMILEAISDAGVKLGLTRELSLQLAAETARGAAGMVLHTKEHPASLKDKVTSPGGTTIDALYELEKGGLRAVLIDGVIAAARKADEQSK